MSRRPLRAANPAALALALVTSACDGATGATKPGVVRVVAAENFWGDIARQIGGKHVEVTSLISDPNADPHLFESNPQAVAEVSTAQLVLVNGLGYDAFMTKLLAAGGSRPGRIIVTLGREMRGVAHVENPHIWYSAIYVPAFADAISRHLATLDPDDRGYFAARLRRFVQSMQPVIDTIAAIKRKYAGTPVAYTERLPGYLLDAAGLKVASPTSFAQAIEDGNDPSPGDVVTFDSAITNHKVRVLIYNAQVVDAATERLKQLAISSHIPVVGMTETMTAHTTFQ